MDANDVEAIIDLMASSFHKELCQKQIDMILIQKNVEHVDARLKSWT